MNVAGVVLSAGGSQSALVELCLSRRALALLYYNAEASTLPGVFGAPLFCAPHPNRGRCVYCVTRKMEQRLKILFIDNFIFDPELLT